MTTLRPQHPRSLLFLMALALATLGPAACGDNESETAGISAGASAGDPDDDDDDDDDDPADSSEEPTGARIAGIGVGGGPDELTYAGVGDGSEELEAWGPAAYVIDERGHNWLADGPGHKLLVIDDDSVIVDRYDLDGLVRGLADIAVTATHVYVLTVGGDAPVIARTGRHDVAGSAWETFELPPEIDGRLVTGLRRDPAGAVAIDLAFGREHLTLFTAAGEPLADPLAEHGGPTALHRVAGHTVELRGYRGEAGGGDESGGEPTRGALVVDGVEVASVTTAGLLGAFSLLGVTADDHLWIRVADVAFADGAIQTRSLAYRFTLGGELVESVELPMRDQRVWVEHRLAIEPEGDLRVLSAGVDEVTLRRPHGLGGVAGPLPPRPGTTPYLPTVAAPVPAEPAPASGMAPRSQCMSRPEIMQRAYEYANYEAVYNHQHMKSCAGRTPVAYFQNRLGQTIRGVAYKYAGHHEVSTYHHAVLNNYTVGDLNTPTDKVVDGCSYGVDCSGFVSRAWRSGHKTTASFHQVSHTLASYDALTAGDALNKPGSHIRLVAENLGSHGVQVVESTVGQERMRVIVRVISWESAGYAAGYAPIRYNGLCPEIPPPPPPRTTHVLFDASGYLPATSGYTPVGPKRLLDTRITDGSQEHSGPLADDTTLAITIAGRQGLPPAKGLGAVVLSVTAAEVTGQGYVAVYPGPQVPGTSTLNFVPGENTAALVVVDPGDDGNVALHHVTTPGETSQVIVDVFGYFPPTADLTMITPTRVFDSRAQEHGGQPLVPGTTEVQLAGVAGIPVVGVGAVIANLTVVAPADAGYATLFAAGTPQPTTSNLNYVAGRSRANLVVLPLSAKGFASLYTHSSAHYLVDVLGWFGGGVDFTPIPPLRLRDTRIDDAGPLVHDTSIAIDVTNAPTIPGDAVAVLGTLTAVAPTAWGFLQVYTDALPPTSNLNFSGGGAVANAVISGISAAGQIQVRAHVGQP